MQNALSRRKKVKFRLTHSKDLPRAYNPIVKRVDHVEHVGLPESHLALLRLFVVEMGSAKT